MPWVRLHGTKDYYGMAHMLAGAGGAVKATINLVPSLVEQIEQYATGTAEDEHLTLSATPPADLGPSEREHVLDLFFMANPDQIYIVEYERSQINIDDPKWSAYTAPRHFNKSNALMVDGSVRLLTPEEFDRDKGRWRP